MTLTIAGLQHHGVPGDVEANLALVADAARQASDRGADLLVTPEMFITGYNLGDRLAPLATPELIDREAHGFGFEHHAQPRVVTVTQSTELGTVYTPEELQAVCEHAQGLGLTVHLDGARLANAAASLDASLAEITTDAGVDLVSFGGTKNGLMFGEAVVFLRPGLGEGFAFVRKQLGQLASKMRFVAVIITALAASVAASPM